VEEGMKKRRVFVVVVEAEGFRNENSIKSLAFHRILPEIGSIFVFNFDFDFEIVFDFDFD